MYGPVADRDNDHLLEIGELFNLSAKIDPIRKRLSFRAATSNHLYV